ncbi:MAG: TIGR00725 family protein [Actinobacteria bacterium]|nr:TIGR00725 family protein [Actinomycetota bacterium]
MGVRGERPPVVAVVGSGEADPEMEAIAERVGARLAARGAVLVCGGLGGVMAAACRGARGAGGTTVGVLPGSDRSAANPFVDVVVATGLGEARNTVVVRTADAVVAVGGGYGTLSEVGFALKLGRPVVGLGTWELARRGRRDEGISAVAGPEEAVDTALALAGV